MEESVSETEIEERVGAVLEGIPPEVTVVAAAKTRTAEEVAAAVRGGIRHVGHNYVQEAEAMFEQLGHAVQWHFIGHLQRNKARRAARLFDMVETVDSPRLASALDRQCAAAGRTMPVLIEVNSGREEAKAGVGPEEIDALADHIAALEHLALEGLMTMGPASSDPEELRPYFRATRRAFDRLRSRLPLRHLSMGMSDSYLVAIEEGATLVRLGTILFGPRER
jgi:pyridoxal phosphate enzyme (YggS family)